MNQVDRQRRINEALNYLRIGNRGHLNCIRLSSQSKGPHNDKIIEMCKDFLYSGIPFVTEAALVAPYGRPDILCPSDFTIYEIMKSETESRFATKKYPEVFEVIKVRI